MKTQEEMDRLVKQYTKADTYPLSQGPRTDYLPEGQAPLAPPAPAPGGNGAASNAPAAAQANESQAGAGGTSAQQALIENTDPKTSIDTAEQSAQAISGKTGATAKAGPQAAQTKQQLNETLKAQGVNPQDAFKSLYEKELEKIDARYKANEITKREYKGWKNRWKNLFNTIPEEDFGVFMMDFGLRMMQASGQGETLGASMGMAGQGALQGALQRKEFDTQQSMQREGQAYDRALARAGLAKRIPAQVESTEQGLIERGPDGQWRPIVDPETGKPYRRDYASNRAYQGKEVWLSNFLQKAGYTDQEIASRLAGGAPRDVLAQEFMADLMKMRGDASYTDTIQIGGKEVRMKDMTPTQMRQYVDLILNELYGQPQGPALQQ